MPIVTVAAWPAVSEPALGFHFATAAEAARAYDPAAYELAYARSMMRMTFNAIHTQYETERATTRRPALLASLAEILNGLVDLDANTGLWAIERQQEAEAWADSAAGRRAVAR